LKRSPFVIAFTCLLAGGIVRGEPAPNSVPPSSRTYHFDRPMSRAVLRTTSPARSPITYPSPCAAWAGAGEGRGDADMDALKWSHAGANEDTDGWYLATFDHPDGGRGAPAGPALTTIKSP
jgi:hypothetical protein